jgi:hypothetical protein
MQTGGGCASCSMSFIFQGGTPIAVYTATCKDGSTRTSGDDCTVACQACSGA